jgi:hypothetical protein
MNVSYYNLSNFTWSKFAIKTDSGHPSGTTLTYGVPNITGSWEVAAFFVRNGTVINLNPVYYTVSQWTGLYKIDFNFGEDGFASRGLWLFVFVLIAAGGAIAASRLSVDAATFVPVIVFGIATVMGVMLWYEFLLILITTIFIYVMIRRPFG